MEAITHDIDEILAKSGLKLKLDGKEYDVIDIPFDIFLESTEAGVEKREISPRDMKTYLAKCLKVDEKELDSVGLYGISFAVNKIREWMEERAGLMSSKDAGDDSVPPSVGGKQLQK